MCDTLLPESHQPEEQSCSANTEMAVVRYNSIPVVELWLIIPLLRQRTMDPGLEAFVRFRAA